jgi:putative nucleotidyltransferase with HDIG domain
MDQGRNRSEPGAPDDTSRTQLADDLIRRFGATMRSAQLYSPGHPLVAKNVASLAETLRALHATETYVAIGLIKSEIIVADIPLPKASEVLGELFRRLEKSGVERITIEKGVTEDEILEFARRIASLERMAAASQGDGLSTSRIRVGRIQAEESGTGATDAASIRKLYNEAVSMANLIWESARLEGGPDPSTARAMVDGLAQAVMQHRSALVALTALREYDNYTFTHMVNVSILTMAQARSLGVDGTLLREFGLAALMHDIGKVRTPVEILNKPEKLDDSEFTIMKRHTIDGAEILRRTPEIPALAPVVAFEHHLRLDGTGYPDGVRRANLNLGTMLCSIADVYDAMRSQRKYQEAFPSERILAVLHRNDGQHFDQNLVRRFVQLMGIYPVGNLVRLNTDEIAVVLQVHAPDPYRPKVRVVIARDGRHLNMPVDVNLWEARMHSDVPHTISAPVDPAEFGIDPLSLMN